MGAENQSSAGGQDAHYDHAEPLSPQEPLENQLLRTIPAIVQAPQMNLPDMVRSDQRLQMSQDAPGGGTHHAVPRNLDQYRFVPAVRVKSCNEDHLSGATYGLPPGVQTHYTKGPDNKPVLDAPIGIGIVIDKDDGAHLCAISTAQANNDTNTIDIIQIQGSITEPGVKPELGGFNWSETCVKAWETIAGHVGASAVTIQSSETLVGRISPAAIEVNPTLAERAAARYQKRYNRTAERMGYGRDNPDRPYSKPVIGGTQVTLSPIDAGIGTVSNYRRLLQGIIYQLENPVGGILGEVLAAQYQLDWAGDDLDVSDLVNDVEFISGVEFPTSVHDGYEKIAETYSDSAKAIGPDIIEALRRAAEVLRSYETQL